LFKDKKQEEIMKRAHKVTIGGVVVAIIIAVVVAVHKAKPPAPPHGVTTNANAQ
jgi:hypothetical protein